MGELTCLLNRDCPEGVQFDPLQGVHALYGIHRRLFPDGIDPDAKSCYLCIVVSGQFAICWDG
jgi:hypothetical protein